VHVHQEKLKSVAAAAALELEERKNYNITRWSNLFIRCRFVPAEPAAEPGKISAELRGNRGTDIPSPSPESRTSDESLRAVGRFSKGLLTATFHNGILLYI